MAALFFWGILFLIFSYLVAKLVWDINFDVLNNGDLVLWYTNHKNQRKYFCLIKDEDL
jgi:hypothetical protein